MNHIRFKLTGQLFDDESVMWAFVDTYSTSYAQGLGDMWLAGLFVHDDAFLTISHGWTVVKTFVVALLGLTIVFLENRNSHEITSAVPELHHQ